MSTAGLSSDQACITLPPVMLNYVPKGHWQEKGIGELKTYASTPGESKKAVLYIYDIGGFCSQNYQGADLLASTGLHVFIPDMFRGKPLDLPKLTSMPKDEANEIRTTFRAPGGPGNMDEAVETFQGMVEEVRKMGYEKVAGVGFCWGGSLVALTPSLNTHVMVHPGQQVDIPAAEELKNPTCLLPSMNEDETKMEAFHKTMLSKPCANQCVLKWYKDMPHGWCSARADLGSENGKKQFQDAFEVMAGFLSNVL